MITLLKRYTAMVVIVLLALFGLGLLLRVHLGGAHNSSSTEAPLPQDDSEQIQIDPLDHSIIVKRPTGITKQYLSDHTTTIDVQKNGNVIVSSPQYGFEHRLFGGLAYSDAIRGSMGMDGFYWKRLDIGVGIQEQFDGRQPRIFGSISYTLKGNVRVGMIFDHTQHVGVLLSVRI